MVSRFGHLKSGNSDLVEFLDLYGLSLSNPEASKPKFGAGVVLPLHNGDPDYRYLTNGQRKNGAPPPGLPTTTPLPPTLNSLSRHFGDTRWIEENITTIVRETNGTFHPSQLDSRFYKAAYQRSQRAFERRIVYPLRSSLAEQQIYLYSAPTIRTETHWRTGKLLISQGKRVLCVLPKTVELALRRGVTESDLPGLANTIIWLITFLSNTNILIHTSEDLTEAFDEWPAFILPEYGKWAHRSISNVNPCLLSVRASQALLRR